MNPRASPLVILLPLLCVAAVGPATTTESAAPDVPAPLAPLVEYIGGEWRIDATWSNGQPLRGRQVFEWGVGRKFIVARTFAHGPGGEYQRYHTIYGVEDGKLTAWGFTFEGQVEKVHFTIDAQKLSMSRPIKGGTLHQSIELRKPHESRWIVELERDGRREQLMDGLWMRDPAPVASTRPAD